MKKITLPTILSILISAAAVLLLCGCSQSRANQNYALSGQTPAAKSPAQLRIEALETIRQALGDSDSMIRTHAVETVGTARIEEMLSELMKLLKDQSVPVRFAAAVTLGDMNFLPAAPVLQEMLNDYDKNVQAAAAYALTRLGEDHKQKLRQAAKSSDQTVRANAAMLIGKLGDSELLGVIRQILNDKDSSENTKIQAAEAAAMLSDKSIYQRLWALLISIYADDRIMGIRSMAALNTEESRNAVLTMLEDEITEVRLYAAYELARMNNPAGKEILIQYLNNRLKDSATTSKIHADSIAAMVISALKDEKLTGYLEKFFNSSSKELRLKAAEAIILMSQ